MQINVSVTLAQGEQLEASFDEAAAKVVAAFGADPATDQLSIHVMTAPVTATFGAPYVPPELEGKPAS